MAGGGSQIEACNTEAKSHTGCVLVLGVYGLLWVSSAPSSDMYLRA
jgi:hypothetical protein